MGWSYVEETLRLEEDSLTIRTKRKKIVPLKMLQFSSGYRLIYTNVKSR